MNQISKLADAELNKLSRDIGRAEEQLKVWAKEKDESWERVFGFMEEFDASPLFIADDGFTLTRQKREGSPKLDEEKLRLLLIQELPKRQATAAWKAITEPRVNSLMLEKAVLAGLIPASVIDAAISTPDPVYARVRRAWTKGDAERAVIFGVEKKE